MHRLSFENLLIEGDARPVMFHVVRGRAPSSSLVSLNESISNSRVPLEHLPVHSLAIPFLSDTSQCAEERLSCAAITHIWCYVQVLKVQGRLSSFFVSIRRQSARKISMVLTLLVQVENEKKYFIRSGM